MDERLYLNDILIDLSPGSVARSLQVNDFRELKDRQANYSNNIKIPRTPNNEKALDLLGYSGSTSRKPYEIITAKYVLDGIELVTDGNAKIRETSEFYSLVIYDGNIAINDILGIKTLADLNFTSPVKYNHRLSIESMIDSFSKTEGYIYGLNGTPVTVVNSIPCFYIHTLFKMIFNQIGWEVEGDIFTNTDYLSRVITMDKGFDPTVTQQSSKVYNVVNSDQHSGTRPNNFPVSTLVDTFTVQVPAYYEISFTGRVIVQRGTNTNLSIEKNGLSFASISSINPLTGSYNFFAEQGDVIEIFINILPVAKYGGYIYDFTEEFTTNINSYTSYVDIKIEEIIGDTKQIDFVKDVMQRFNLSFRKLPNENTIEFITSHYLLDVSRPIEDWSGKFVRKIKESYTNSYARDNKFKYNYEESGDNFADGSLIVNDLNLKPDQTVLTSFFKAPVFDGVRYNFNYWDERNEPQQDGIRIFKLLNISESLAIRLERDDNFLYLPASYVILDFDELDYQTELDNNNARFKKMLDNYSVFTIDCKLSILDIYNVDFFKLKHIKQLGANFYLNKIINFKNNEITKVELIKIPN